VQRPQEQGGLDGGALYIDTEQTFRPEWIVRMANHLGMDPDAAAHNIIYSEAYNSDHQILLLEKADRIIKENKVRLIIVDSLTAHFRSEYLGREMLAERQQKINKHMHRLSRLARAFNTVAVVTNQVMARPDAFFSMAVEAAGGHIVAHTCLHPDTLVQLADGSITKVSAVHNPLPLVSIDLRGGLQPTTGTCTGAWKTELPEILRIRAGFEIKASPNHRFFKLQGLEIVEVQARDLRVGDYLAYTRRFEVKGTPQRIPIVTSKRFYRLTKKGAEHLKSTLRTHRISRVRLKEATGLTERTLRRVLNQGFPAERKTFETLAELAGLRNLLRQCVPHYSRKHRKVRIPRELSPGLAQALGYVLGDGNLGERSIRLRDQRLPVLKSYMKIFTETFGVKGSISRIRGRHCYQLAINSLEITDLFRRLMNDWKEVVPKSTRECVASFIRGFVDAEGSVSNHVSVTQKDRSILETLQLLLLRFGVKSTICQAAGSWLMRIAEGSSLRNFQREIGLTAPDKAQRLVEAVAMRSRIGGDLIPVDRQIIWDIARSVGVRPSRLIKHRRAHAITRSLLAKFIEVVKGSAGYRDVRQDVMERIRRLEMLVSSPLGWERVRSIDRIEADVPVCDITVLPHANFVANGLLVHNSHTRVFIRRTASGPVRIARLVSSPYLPEGERLFKITENGIEDVEEEDVERR
ncbi:MAG: LAGLIDADG family homing endonuclease, partial [Candidatus Bathyarchaeia archaeon]